MKLAVIKTGGKQYLVKEGDKLRVEKIIAPEGADVKFDQVLLVADKSGSESSTALKGQNKKVVELLLPDKETKIGTPFIEDAKVTAKVLKQARSKKIVVFHYHSKTRYKKKAGHRQHFTEVKIEEIK